VFANMVPIRKKVPFAGMPFHPVVSGAASSGF
jgi:hypothetical protein